MISVSENVYIDKLDVIVSIYNNSYQGTIKWNILMESQAHLLTFV